MNFVVPFRTSFQSAHVSHSSFWKKSTSQNKKKNEKQTHDEGFQDAT